MEFKDVLAHRRMVRNYRSEPVDPEIVERVATAAFRAPSAGNSQGIVVVVVTRENQRRRIAELADEPAYVEAGFDPWISKAPVHVIISVSEQIYHERYQESDKIGEDGEEIAWPLPYWWVDAGAAMMAALLAAVDEGLAAGFLGVHSIPDLRALLDLPDHYSPIGVITIGHPETDRKSASLSRGKRPLSDTLHFENYSEAD